MYFTLSPVWEQSIDQVQDNFYFFPPFGHYKTLLFVYFFFFSFFLKDLTMLFYTNGNSNILLNMYVLQFYTNMHVSYWNFVHIYSGYIPNFPSYSFLLLSQTCFSMPEWLKRSDCTLVSFYIFCVFLRLLLLFCLKWMYKRSIWCHVF